MTTYVTITIPCEGVTGGVFQESRKDELLTFFVQLITMMKHMVDDILPDLLLLFDKPTIESVIRHCDEFDGSLHVFQKLCGVIARNIIPAMKQHPSKNLQQSEFAGNTHACLNEAGNHTGSNDSPPEEPISVPSSSVHTGCNPESDNDDDDHHVWKTLIKKAMKASEKETTSFYYCGLCNVGCFVKNTWDEHVKGKRHVARCSIVVNHSMHCETCGLNILSDVEHISLILESPEHRLLDETITREKRACETNKSDQKSVDLAPPKIKPKSESQNTKCSEKTVFKGKTISPNFAQLTKQIMKRIKNREEFVACYCRPCDVISKSKLNWVDHVSSPKHLSFMKNKAFNNVLCGCIQCDTGVLASKVIALCYMSYHIEQCHDQSTDDIIHEEYMKIIELTTKIEKRDRNNCFGGSSKQSSFKGSTESIHLSRRSSVNDEPSTRAMSVSHQEMPGRSDEQKLIASDNKGNSESSSSCPSLSAQVKSVEDCCEPSKKRSSANSLTSFEKKPAPVNQYNVRKDGALLKYLDDVSAHLKDGRTVSAMASQGPSRSSSRASLRGSQESVNRSSGYFSNNNPASRVRSPLDMDMTVRGGRTGSYGDDVFKTPKPSSVRRSPEPPQFLVSGDSDLIAPFIVLLRHKEMRFRENPSFKPFAALCLLCPSKTFSNAFEWCDHISNHSSNDSQDEVQCSFCNTRIFGNVEEINRVLIPHDEHSRINRLMYTA